MPSSIMRRALLLVKQPGASLMATYWATECLPMVGRHCFLWYRSPCSRTASRYGIAQLLQDKIVLFFGGLVIACALELSTSTGGRCARCCLWARATPAAARVYGFHRLHLYVDVHTATAAMMMPIAEAVLGQLEHAAREELRSHPSSNSRRPQ